MINIIVFTMKILAIFVGVIVGGLISWYISNFLFSLLESIFFK